MSKLLLDVQDLEVAFETGRMPVQAVRGVSFQVHEGETLAIVGESGCGKSVTLQALFGLMPSPPGQVTGGTARFRETSLLDLSERQMNRIRGRRVGMIFQDPMSALNPTMRIGDQIVESLRIHRRLSLRAGRQQAIALLEQVRIADAATRARQYPFEFSGGMLQRAMIALALACEPELLVADEPTTALDVTIQAQILSLLQSLQRSHGMAIVLVTHDLGVVARMADRVAVMYAGQIVETGSVRDVFHAASHPYTEGLRQATPSNRTGGRQPLRAIEGTPPDLSEPPAGCGYYARCPHAMRVCETHPPPEFQPSASQRARCWLHHDLAPRIDLTQPATTGTGSHE